MSNGKPKDAAAVAEAWWQDLTQAGDGATLAQGWRCAVLARLRRAGAPLDVMMEPHALRLIQRLRRFKEDRVAIVAGVLASVRKDVDRPIVRIVGRSSLDDEASAVLSENRFRRLLQTPTEDLLEPMRRLVRLAKEEANVRHLAESILYWGDLRKRQWIFDYYAASSAARSSSEAEAAATNLAPRGDMP